jgi:predicted RNA binding protein YcfA (HicA-like mRNA interferase family)
MPALAPISRRVLISHLRRLGFHGPVAGTRHQFMLRRTRKIFLPNPHGGEISIGLLTRILKQAGISRREWQAL